jgi:hypothetical protein
MTMSKSVMLLLCLWIAVSAGGEASAPDTRPRVFVMTDIGGDPDDQQSLVRFLLYANEFDIAGISCGLGKGHESDAMPQMALDIIDAYAADLPRLRIHAPGYPDAAALKKRLSVDVSKASHKDRLDIQSAASRAIIKVLKSSDPRPVWFLGWGGPRALSAALFKLSRTLSPAEYQKVKAKVRIYDIYGQDSTAGWLRSHNDLFYIHSNQAFRGMYQKIFPNDTMTALAARPWIVTNVKGHGALGERYPEGADGKEGLKEGDTPSFLYLLPNGLGAAEHPSWENWGGTGVQIKGQQPYFLSNDKSTIARWRREYQADFAARMDWAATDSFAKANHPPQVIVNNQSGTAPLYLPLLPGSTLTLDGSASTDVDNDSLSFAWSILGESSGCTLQLQSRGATATVTVPTPCTTQDSIHILLSVQDSGTPPLSRYRRIILSQPAAAAQSGNSSVPPSEEAAQPTP